MSDFVFVTGKLGQGKTLISIAKIKSRIESGCLVATNCDIFLHHMFHRKTDKPRVMRIPDKPSLPDLQSIGRGRPKHKGYDESRNGLLVLDECGDWFNSRNWADKTRSDVNSWFRHARKLGWDVYLIVQDISLIDSQARSALAASIARCKRLDKISIPFVTSITKLFGYAVRLPRIHAARVEDADGLFQDRWVYRGDHLYASYDTEQIFNPNYPHSTYSLLTPWHVYGRYAVPMNKENTMRITKIYWKRFSRPAVAIAASFVTMLTTYFSLQFMPQPAESKPDKVAELVEEEEQPKPLSEVFHGWHYRGSMNVNGKITYYLTSDDGVRMSSKTVIVNGLMYTEVGYCSLRVSKDDDSHFLQCDQALAHS